MDLSSLSLFTLKISEAGMQNTKPLERDCDCDVRAASSAGVWRGCWRNKWNIAVCTSRSKSRPDTYLFCLFPTDFHRRTTVRRRLGVRGMNNFKIKAYKLAINKVQEICFASKGYFNQFWALTFRTTTIIISQIYLYR